MDTMTDVCETHTGVCAQISAQFRKEFLRKLLNYSAYAGLWTHHALIQAAEVP